MRREVKIYLQAASSPSNVSFSDLCYLLEAVGFERRGKPKGSHTIFKHPDIKDSQDAMMNVQEVRGQAKAYQVNIALRVIEKYDLMK